MAKHLGVVPARCGYRTGKCLNLQAFKRNGKLHKLCEFHRERANLNQKKLDRKKRMQRSKIITTGSPSASTSFKDEACRVEVSNAGRSPRTVEAVISDMFVTREPKLELNELRTDLIVPTNLNEAPLALDCEDLAIFCSLMKFDANNRASDKLASTHSCHYYTSTV
ncbi:hypothetical protein PsorP6_008568 [Peronosclerospora sorghi]|uniref:Uncharacterized protein n=1 Tax=Peronosclerospora sorghi TaxID=230839 RepID=A0ACC0WCT3_9STRA|nr:hypothetical protein PsorP6_008568 [Peronosclerospora sorghi]